MIPLWAALTMTATICWGFAYAVLGKLLHAGLSSSFVLSSIAVVTLTTYASILFRNGSLENSMSIVSGNKWLLFYLLITALALISGQFLVYKAIALKDAPHVAILEISYPIFTCLFTWLLFRNLELSWNIILGGVLIFIGSGLVLFKTGQ